MYTFYRDGVYYSSPNAAYLPEVPPFQNSVPAKLEQLQHPLWLSNKHPYLALLPVSVRFSGPILFRFGFTRASVPVEVNPQHGQWALKPNLMTRWMNMEGALHWMIPTLHRHSRFGMQTQIAPIATPMFSGYMLGYTDEASARTGAIASRDAFIPKFCELSWALLMHPGDATSDTPEWMATLIHDYHVHPEWVHALRNSVFGDFTSPENRRHGAFVDPFTSKWNLEIRVLEAVNVPLWFRWENGFYTTASSSFHQYCPDRSARALAIANAINSHPPPELRVSFPPFRVPRQSSDQPPSSAPLSPTSMSLFPSPPPRSVPPPPEQYSGQRAGESMADFFSRQTKRHNKRLETETPGNREIRLQREQAHAKTGQPGKRATVYQWVDHNGFRIRTRVPCHDIENIWDIYCPQHMRYNSWDNQWDVCTEFGDLMVHQQFDDTTPLWSPESPPLSAQGMLF
jgi:hypothetical protein